MEMGGLTQEQADHIVAQAEAKAAVAEKAAAEQRRSQRAQDRVDAAEEATKATVEGATEGAAEGVVAETTGEATEEALHETIEEQGSPEEEDGHPVVDVDQESLSDDEPATEEDSAAADANGTECAEGGNGEKSRTAKKKAAARRFDSNPARPPALRSATQVGRGHLPIRIYALAKELKIDNKKLVDICTKAGIKGKGSCASQSDG